MLAALALALATSAHAGAPEADASESWIVNGTEIGKAAFPAAVAIGFELPGGRGRQATCSASFITPKILLTAAHCTDEFEKYGLSKDLLTQFAVAFLTDDVSTSSGQVIGFADYVNHPDYSGSSQRIRNDLGVIVLEEESSVRPVWIAPTAYERDELVGEKVVSVGFGITSSSNQNSGGVKRKGNLKISGVDDQFLYVDASDNKDRSNVCSGDSGGPQYHVDAHGRVTQWGIHSFVYSLSGGSDPCLVSSGSTRTDAFRDWILNQVEKVHGEVDECALAGRYGDLVCDTDCVSEDADCVADVDADGLVSADELADADADGDGLLTLDEALQATGAGCSHTGSAPAGLALAGLALLGLRRRRA